MTVAVQVVGIARTYRPRRRAEPSFSLADVSFDVAAGEALMLVGPNGAGKSTVLRLVSGIELPDAGSVRILGEKPRGAAARMATAYLPDDSELFPHLDAIETLEFFAAAADATRAERRARIDEAIDRLGMRSWCRKRVQTYSLGMRRRLGLGCVLVRRASVVILDEPVSGLDPGGARLFVDLMRAEKERGAALVFASHRLGHVEALCDRIVVLRDGRPAFAGEVAELARKVGGIDLTLEGLAEEDLERVLEFVREVGGRVRAHRISETTLEDYLLGDSRNGE